MMLPRILNLIDTAAESLPFWAVMIVFGFFASLAVYFIHKNLAAPKEEVDKWYLKQGWILIIIVLPVLLAAWLISISLHAYIDIWQNWWWWVPWVTLGVAGINAGVWMVRRTAIKDFWYRLFFVMIAVGVGCTLVWGLAPPFSCLDGDTRTVLGVPLLLVIMTLGGILYVGLMGRGFGTRSREWWGRIGAWIKLYGLVYLAVFAISIYGAKWLDWINLNAPSWLNEALTSGWILTTIGGLLAGKSDSTGPKDSPLVLNILIKIAPYIFILGLALVLATGIDALIHDLVTDANLSLLGKVLYLCGLFAALLITAMLLSWRVNINEFSMHNYYRNRLVRCYIGASDYNRKPNPFTGFDPKQHKVRISDLTTEEPDTGNSRIIEADLAEPYAGPYYLVNVTLNLVAGDNLAWQQRKATSFIFGPKYSGYDVWAESQKRDLKNLDKNGFRPTAGYEDGLSLGTAMAISGAAVNPNMGHFSSPAVGFLMTIFNVRLGYWLGNPRHRLSWAKSGPVAGLAYLFFELFGMTNDQRRFVNLSDGGHFENLGLYELVRRRCRFIVVGDGGQDIDMQFGELGNVIDKCRTDFGIEIEIDVEALRGQPDSELSLQHCAVGTIRYDKLDPEQKSGILLYIKSTLTGDEPADVLSYAAQNTAFPNQSTADQWFDESQFESYRALGEHSIHSIFGNIGDKDTVSDKRTEDLFNELAHYLRPNYL